MKFTQDNLKSMISEEIDRYLSERADEDDPLRAIATREEVMAKLEKLYAYIADVEDQLRKRGIDPDGPTIGPTGTQIVEPLAVTPVGEKPRRSSVAATRLLDPKN
jgi:hypothetical protein